MSDIIRVVRVLEYTGPRANVEATLAKNAVKGTTVFGDLTIREATLGSFAEIIGQDKPKVTKPKDLSRNTSDFLWDARFKREQHPAYLHTNVESAKEMLLELKEHGYYVEREGLKVTVHLQY